MQIAVMHIDSIIGFISKLHKTHKQTEQNNSN